MTINPVQFSAQIVIPTLQALQTAGIPYSTTAYHLVMGTIAQESLMGTYLVQVHGPALGIIQISPTTLGQLMADLTPIERGALAAWSSPSGPLIDVVNNLGYAVAVCRLFYWHVPAPLPPDTMAGIWAYYKKWWNTDAGSATEEEFMQNWALTGLALN